VKMNVGFPRQIAQFIPEIREDLIDRAWNYIKNQPRQSLREWNRRAGEHERQNYQTPPRKRVRSNSLSPNTPVRSIPMRNVRGSYRRTANERMFGRSAFSTSAGRRRGGPPRGRIPMRRRRSQAPRKGRRYKKKRYGRRTTLSYGGRGSTKVVENGGLVTQSDTAYIGVYSSPVVQVIESVTRAIYRALMKESGMDFSSWTERTLFSSVGYAPHFILIQYRKLNSIPVAPAVLSSDAIFFQFDTDEQTHQEAANLINLEIWKVVESGIPITLSDIQFGSLNWDTTGEIDVNRRTLLAQLRPKQLKLTLTCSNKLEIQNRTKAADTVSEQVNESALNIANNPVTGYLYTTNSSAFKPKADDGYRAEVRFYSDTEYGLIRNATLGFNDTGAVTPTIVGDLQNYIKPPKPNFFQKTIGKKVTIAPGAMFSTTARWKKTFALNDLFNHYLPTLQLWNTTIPTYTTPSHAYLFGQSKMFALERMLDSRESSDTQSVNVAFEHTMNISSAISKVQAYCAPLNQVIV